MGDTLDTVLGLSMPKASEDTLKHLIPAGVRSAKRRINTADLRHVVDFGVWVGSFRSMVGSGALCGWAVRGSWMIG